MTNRWDIAQDACELVHTVVGVVVDVFVDYGVHDVHDVCQGGGRLKFGLYVGFNVALLALYHQGDVDVVACVYLVPHDEAVEIRPGGDHSYHSRDYDVHEGEVRHILPVFADEVLDVLYGDILLKEVLSIETGAHYEGNNVVNGVDVPYTPAVIAVAEASFESILHLVPPV